jgi:hypothetical protein
MPDFFVHLSPSRECIGSSEVVAAASSLFEKVLFGRLEHVSMPHARLLVSRDSEAGIDYYADGRGFIVRQGFCFHPESDGTMPRLVPLEEMFQQFLDGEDPRLLSVEGTFVCQVWDETKRRGLLWNDQAGTNYASFHSGGLGHCISTNGLVLARSLGVGLDPAGVSHLLIRGQLPAPYSVFSGLRRLSLGESAIMDAKGLRVQQHWLPYREERRLSFRESVDVISDAARKVMLNYRSLGLSCVTDLTAGYDTRMVLCAAMAAGLPVGTTVNGEYEDTDVAVAREVASGLGLPFHYYRERDLWNVEIDSSICRELLYRTAGELRYTEAYHHRLTRPELASRYQLHFAGSGNNTTRYYPWGQEFFGIGRRRLANIDNAIRYRYLHHPPPPGLLPASVLPAFVEDVRQRLTQICTMVPGSRTTAQLDAAFIWKAAGHVPAYHSAVSGFLFSLSPLNSVSYVGASLEIPWPYKLTSHLSRSVAANLAPKAASFRTQYGASAAPPSLATLPQEALQLFKRTHHLFAKVDRVLLGGRLLSRSVTPPAVPPVPPYVSEHFRDAMRPDAMFSAALYEGEGLGALLSPLWTQGPRKDMHIQRVATVEFLCRELNFRPGKDFWSQRAG